MGGDGTVSLFHKVSSIVNSELTLHEMLGQIVGLAAQVSHCDACLVYLVEPETGEFVLRASQVPHAHDRGSLRMKVGEGITGWVAEHQSPVALSSRASSDPRFKGFSTLVEDTYEAFLSVPIVNKGKTVGVINIHHRDPHTHAPDEIASVSFIGEQMGSAISKSLLEDENARLAERDLKQEQERLRLEEEVAKRTAELRAMNEELRAARDRAEEMARLKSEFLANISHELRTPMNGILGMTELALETELKTEQREFLQIAKSSADSLLRIISDLLDFSALETNKVMLEKIEFDLADIVKDTVGALAAQAQERGLELTYHLDPDVPSSITGDPRSLRQILLNLVGNGIKFTDRGKVTIRISVESALDAEGVLHFAVADTGMGIPKEKRANIFDAFVQVDGSSTRRYGGTGLGLAICASLVKLMGGKIWVESEPGRGSTFHFMAPYSRMGAARPDHSPRD